jgi:dimeric dUTPase (all-alpha-NTP-PPase superfamily)
MGHERIGLLPKSKKWNTIINELSAYDGGADKVIHIAREALNNVRNRYIYASEDSGFLSAFKFLLTIAITTGKSDRNEILKSLQIHIGKNPTPYTIVKALNEAVAKDKDSLEYAEISIRAASDAIISYWKEEAQGKTNDLFGNSPNGFETIDNISTGSGFCEISRLFFSNFTERYLKYFLDRGASRVFNSISDRDKFNSQLSSHIASISQLAFESSKITQSYSAGWFNKNTKGVIPKDKVIKNFLSYASHKMREELLRESQGI